MLVGPAFSIPGSIRAAIILPSKYSGCQNNRSSVSHHLRPIQEKIRMIIHISVDISEKCRVLGDSNLGLVPWSNLCCSKSRQPIQTLILAQEMILLQNLYQNMVLYSIRPSPEAIEASTSLLDVFMWPPTIWHSSLRSSSHPFGTAKYKVTRTTAVVKALFVLSNAYSGVNLDQIFLCKNHTRICAV